MIKPHCRAILHTHTGLSSSNYRAASDTHCTAHTRTRYTKHEAVMRVPWGAQAMQSQAPPAAHAGPSPGGTVMRMPRAPLAPHAPARAVMLLLLLYCSAAASKPHSARATKPGAGPLLAPLMPAGPAGHCAPRCAATRCCALPHEGSACARPATRTLCTCLPRVRARVRPAPGGSARAAEPPPAGHDCGWQRQWRPLPLP